MPRPIGPGWHGHITSENAEEIAVAMLRLLEGKTYTYSTITATNIPKYLSRLTCHANERLKERGGWAGGGHEGPDCPLLIHRNDDGVVIGFSFSTTYGMLMFDTFARTRADICTDESYRYTPYIHFEYSQGETIQIRRRNGYGEVMLSVLAIHDDEEVG